MKVYHGSNKIIKTPDVLHTLRLLDFGEGFYVTTNKEQAERWARRKVYSAGTGVATLNEYDLSDDINDFKVKDFNEDLYEWIDFVCKCRRGDDIFKNYDVIFGKVANDKVFRVVNLYFKGIWDKERTIKEIKAYPHYDQFAFITQKAIDKLLTYVASYKI